MNFRKIQYFVLTAALIFLITLLYNEIIIAHCDTLDGPVVKACQKSLETGNINYTLIWVQEKDEQIIKDAFKKTLEVRKLNNEARDLADMNFFETVVRIHRMGEGASYDGVKPAGTDMGPAIPAGDEALKTGSVKEVEKLLEETLRDGLHKHFHEVMEKKAYDPDNVNAGREYVKAYVEYIHYVERLYDAMKTSETHHMEHEKHGN